jgi:hypothetical protein
MALRLTLLSRVDAEQPPPRGAQRPGEGRCSCVGILIPHGRLAAAHKEGEGPRLFSGQPQARAALPEQLHRVRQECRIEAYPILLCRKSATAAPGVALGDPLACGCDRWFGRSRTPCTGPSEGREELAARPGPGFSVEAVQTPARVNVTCVTPLGEEVASTL